jgi:hypothetical protein
MPLVSWPIVTAASAQQALDDAEHLRMVSPDVHLHHRFAGMTRNVSVNAGNTPPRALWSLYLRWRVPTLLGQGAHLRLDAGSRLAVCAALDQLFQRKARTCHNMVLQQLPPLSPGTSALIQAPFSIKAYLSMIQCRAAQHCTAAAGVPCSCNKAPRGRAPGRGTGRWRRRRSTPPWQTPTPAAAPAPPAPADARQCTTAEEGAG